MPIGPRIAVIGAGNRRVAIPVLATLFNLPPDAGDVLVLYDEHAEMLDLFDRVAKAFAAYCGVPGLAIVATQDLHDALEGADAVLVCTDLIPATLTFISHSLHSEVNRLVFNLVEPTSVSGMFLDAQAFHIDWPDRVDEDKQYVFAHRGLRLVRGDEPIFEPLQEFKENPLATAIMDSRPAPENRYDPKAIENLGPEEYTAR